VKGAISTTVGYLVAETKDKIALAQSQSPNETGNIWVIPRAVIEKIVELVPISRTVIKRSVAKEKRL